MKRERTIPASLSRLPLSRKAWACRIPLPIILLVLSCFIALFSFAAHAACSAYAGATSGPITSKISINEYNYSGNYIELKIIDPSIVTATNSFTGWVLSVYKRSGNGFSHETFSVRDAYLSTDVSACGTSSPYIKIPVSSLGNDSNVVLWSSAPALLQEVDYFRVGQNAYPTYQPSTCFATAEFPASSAVTWHQSALTGSAARKDIARGPDGTGVWIETPYTGSDQGTPCTTNDSTLLLSKTVTSASTVKVGELVSFLVDVSLSSRASAQSSVVVNDLLPSGLSYVSHTASAGTYVPGTGVWTIGSLSAGGRVTLNITARTTLVGALVNKAAVQSSDFPAGTISLATATVTALQPLVLTKTVSPASVLYNTAATFTVSVTNNSTAALPSAFAVNDTLPAGLTAGTPTVSPGTSYSGGVWTINSGMPAGATYTLTLPVTSQTTSGSFINTATAVAPFGGPNLIATATLTVGAMPASFIIVAPDFKAGDGIQGTITAPTISGAPASGFANSTRKLKFYYQTTIPAAGASGNMKMDAYEALANTIASVGTVATSLAAAVVRDVYFDANGVGRFDINFDNVGRFLLFADWLPSYEITPPAGAPSSISGNDAFVVSPYRYEIVPSATAMAGGSSFNLTVTAQALCGKVGWGYTCPFGAAYTTATNFSGTAATDVTVGISSAGLISAPALWCTTVTPSCPNDEATAPVVNAAAFSNGVATLTGLHWSEVGSLVFQGEANYLGSGATSIPGGSANFHPGRFSANGNVASSAGSFIYYGQPGLTITQSISADVLKPNGTYSTARNYSPGVYGGTLAIVSSQSKSGGSDVNVCPDAVCGSPVTNAVSSCTWNEGQCSISAANALFQRDISAIAPVNPQTVNFTVVVTDAEDKVTVCAKITNPTLCAVQDNPTSNVLTFDYGALIARFGRLRLINAYGSELLRPRVEYRAEYWDGSRWAINSLDSTTSLVSGNIVPGGLTVNAVTPLNAGVGSITFNTAAVGSYDIALNLGTTTVDSSCNPLHPATVAGNRPWLKGFWALPANCGGAVAWAQDPNARIRLGSPKAPYIYLRERY